MEIENIELGSVAIAELLRDKLIKKYGDNIDEDIQKRVNEELDWFSNHLGLEWLEKVAAFIRDKREEGEYIIPRLFSNNSLLLYLLDITTVNPLPAHYYCPHHHQFAWGVSAGETCPECGETLIQDGFDLDFAFFAQAMAKEKPTLDYSGTCQGDSDLRVRFVAQKSVERVIKMAKCLGITQKDLETNVTDETLCEIIRCAKVQNRHYFQRYTKENAYARPVFIGLPDLGNALSSEAIGVFYPQTLDQLADLYAGLHGRGIYEGNFLFLEPDSSPSGFAFSCDSLLRFLTANEVDKPWALRIVHELRRNYEGELSKESEKELMELAWPEDYISFLKGISYLFFKGNEVAELRLELRLAEMFLNDPVRYYEAFFSADKEVLEEARNAYSHFSEWHGAKTDLSEAELAIADILERGLDIPKILKA